SESLPPADVATVTPEELTPEPFPFGDNEAGAGTLDTPADAKGAPTEPSATESEVEPLAEAQILAARLADDITLAMPLAALYRQLQLGDLGEQQAGMLGLDELADTLESEFEQALAADNLARAREVATAAR